MRPVASLYCWENPSLSEHCKRLIFFCYCLSFPQLCIGIFLCVKTHVSGPVSGTPFPLGDAERDGTVLHGEEKAQGVS